MENDTTGESEAQSQGRFLQITNENKVVKDILEKIDKNVERIQKCEAYGAFNCATYVISSDLETNAVVASGYSALMKGDNSSLQASHINRWNAKASKGKEVKEYLKRLSHPLFTAESNPDVIVSPASLANSYELAVNLAFPKKSINGLPVYETASFGRNIQEYAMEDKSSSSICMGNVFHMGAEQK